MDFPPTWRPRIHENFVGVLIASVINLALDRLRALAFGAVIPAAVFQIIDGNVLDVILLRNDGAPRFEDESVESFFSELFCRPAAGDARADDDCVVSIGCHMNLPYAFFCSGKGTQPW